jgi:hypothetical protein
MTDLAAVFGFAAGGVVALANPNALEMVEGEE